MVTESMTSTSAGEAPVHTPEQLRQVNALCRLVEMAEPMPAAS